MAASRTRDKTQGPCPRADDTIDVLTLFPNLARRVITMTPPKTTGADVAIDLPATVNDDSVVAVSVGENSPLSILPSRVKQNQLLLQLPAGQVRVLDSEGSTHQGTLIKITPAEITLKTPSVSELRLPEYQALTFVERWEPRVSVSYELNGLSWDSRHIMLVQDGAVVGFQTKATVRNNTGMIFNHLTDLVLSYERPNRTQERYRGGGGPGAAPRMMKMAMLASAAPTMQMDMATEAVESKSSAQRRVSVVGGSASDLAASGLVGEGGENERTISLGPQELGQDRELTLFDFDDKTIQSRPVFLHMLHHNNDTVQNGWRLKITTEPGQESAIIPAGTVTAFSVVADGSRVGQPLGSAEIREYHTLTPADAKRPRQAPAAAEQGKAKSVLDTIPSDDASALYVWLGVNASVLAQTLVQEQRTRAPTTPPLPRPLAMQGRASAGSAGSAGRMYSSDYADDDDEVVQQPDQTIRIVHPPNRHRVHISTTLINRASKEATVLLRYQLDSQETLLKVQPKPTLRVKGGQLEWVLKLAPKQTTDVVIDLELAM